MVETRNISLGGLLFHVELPAYTALNGLPGGLEQGYCGVQRDRRTSLQEVEYRLAELFTEFMERAAPLW